MSRSGRGTGPPGGSALKPRMAAATSAAQRLALHRHRPDQHVAREAVAQPVQDVADHRAGGRGDDADHLAAGTAAARLRAGVEQALGGERLRALLEHAPAARRRRPAPAPR